MFLIRVLALRIFSCEHGCSILNFDLRTENRVEALQEVADEAKLDIQTVGKLAEHVPASYEYEDILALQYAANPSDSPLIEVNVGGGNYAPIDEVSTGQKGVRIFALQE